MREQTKCRSKAPTSKNNGNGNKFQSVRRANASSAVRDVLIRGSRKRPSEERLNSSDEHVTCRGLGTKSNVTIVKPNGSRVWTALMAYERLWLTSRSSLIFRPPLPIMHPAWLWCTSMRTSISSLPCRDPFWNHFRDSLSYPVRSQTRISHYAVSFATIVRH